MKLARYAHVHDPGAGLTKRVLWYLVNAIVFGSWLVPASAPKRAVLRWFGARIGQGVVLKPRINIKYPWRLSIGDHTWIGEGAWIDNLERVDIAENVCVSQAACILTGNHDYRDEAFALEAASVQVEQGAWLGAFTVVCPGVRVARGTVLTVGSILARDSEPEQVYRGNPAARVRPRYRAGEGDVASPATRSIRMRA